MGSYRACLTTPQQQLTTRGKGINAPTGLLCTPSRRELELQIIAARTLTLDLGSVVSFFFLWWSHASAASAAMWYKYNQEQNKRHNTAQHTYINIVYDTWYSTT